MTVRSLDRSTSTNLSNVVRAGGEGCSARGELTSLPLPELTVRSPSP